MQRIYYYTLLIALLSLTSSAATVDVGVNLTVVGANVTTLPTYPSGGLPNPRFILNLMVSNQHYSPTLLNFDLRISNKGSKAGEVNILYTLTSDNGVPISKVEKLWVTSSNSCALRECPYHVSIQIPQGLCSGHLVTLNVNISNILPPSTYTEIHENACFETIECTTNKQCLLNEACVDNKCFTAQTSIPETASPIWNAPPTITGSLCWPFTIITIILAVSVGAYLYLKKRKAKKEEEEVEGKEEEEEAKELKPEPPQPSKYSTRRTN